MGKQEGLIKWGARWYRENLADVFVLAVHADPEVGNWRLLDKLKPNTTFGERGVIYTGWKFLSSSETGCPIVPVSMVEVSKRGPKGRKLTSKLDKTTGAYRFDFLVQETGATFSVLYVLFEFGFRADLKAVALLPREHLGTWSYFSEKVKSQAQSRFRPSKKTAYVVGSNTQGDFKPEYELADVILPAGMKDEILNQIDYFFERGVQDYQRVRVPAFRKFLVYGEPGTGKSMLSQAIAGEQLKKGRVVVFIAASDRYGASFDKIQMALDICKTSKFPVFMVVEEIESYLTGDDRISQLRNVLEGFEAPNNPKGSVLWMTSNRPHIMDDALLRFGRIDRRWLIPSIQDEAVADQLLRKFLDDLYQENRLRKAARELIGTPPVMVRELSFTARMMLGADPSLDLGTALLTAIRDLKNEKTTQEAFQEEVLRVLNRKRTDNFPGLINRRQPKEEEIDF